MKALILAAILISAAGGPAAAAEFDFLLEEKDGATRVAIVNLETGAAAVVAGGLDLQVTGDAEAATSARALLQGGCAAPETASETPSSKPKVVIHKMSYEEDAYDVRSDKQVRIAGRETIAATDADAQHSDRPAGANAAARRTRTIRISRANDTEVLHYVDDLSLDETELASLKEAIGL